MEIHRGVPCEGTQGESRHGPPFHHTLSWLHKTCRLVPELAPLYPGSLAVQWGKQSDLLRCEAASLLLMSSTMMALPKFDLLPPRTHVFIMPGYAQVSKRWVVS